MPTNKDFKRLVRARMRKTGEAYAAAGSPAFAALAGMSDSTIKARTGCTWERWAKALDYVNASTWSHREIAEYVYDKFKLSGWWSQSVTVGYERIKGLRAIGQRGDGGFEATKSKVFNVPLGRLYRAFRDSRVRRRWLPGMDLAIRSATRDKSMRMTWPDQTLVGMNFVRKGTAKSQVAIQHSKLSDRAAVTRMKQYWADRLGDLAEML